MLFFSPWHRFGGQEHPFVADLNICVLPHRQGAIRLESNAGPSQVSFRDTQDSGEPAQDEKRIESSVLDLQPGAGASSPLCRTSAA